MIYNLPRAKKKRETWVIEQIPNLPYDLITIKIPFESNSTNFQKIEMHGLSLPRSGIYYDAIKVWDTNDWTDEAYRTITLASPATGDLLTWLQSSATKQ